MRSFYLSYPKIDAVRRELSWTHYRILLRVEKPEARGFYETEAVNARWSTRELERQIHSLLFERLALSRDREGVLALSATRLVSISAIGTAALVERFFKPQFVEPSWSQTKHSVAGEWVVPDVFPRTAQVAMRHSTIDLTMNTYTDPKLLDVAGAMETPPSLPRCGRIGTNCRKFNGYR